MIVTEVHVEIHEKRNNPYSYGHYDASVRMVAQVAEDESPDDVVSNLIERARLAVLAECGQWETSVAKSSPESYYPQYIKTLDALRDVLGDIPDDLHSTAIDAARAEFENPF